MLAVNVKGGTGAGAKRPMQNMPEPWVCRCGRVNQGFIVRCLKTGCNQARP